jgi:hypothetical protein
MDAATRRCTQRSKTSDRSFVQGTGACEGAQQTVSLGVVEGPPCWNRGVVRWVKRLRDTALSSTNLNDKTGLDGQPLTTDERSHEPHHRVRAIGAVCPSRVRWRIITDEELFCRGCRLIVPDE